MCDYNDMAAKGKDFPAQAACALRKQLDSYDEMLRKQPEEGSATQEVFGLVGLGASGIASFVSKVSQSVDKCLQRLRHNATVKVKKAVTDATTFSSAVPDVATDEAAYRLIMKTLSGKLADQQQTLENGVALGVAAFALAPKPFKEEEGDLVKKAEQLQSECMFHVCFYAALSVFRDPKFGTEEGGDAKFKQFGSIMGSLEQVAEQVNFGKDLLQDMRSALQARY